MKITEESIYNLFLGMAIGDAFGAGVEFQDREWIKKHVDFNSFVNVRELIKIKDFDNSIFTRNYHAWEYTDDTEMTIGIINALLSEKGFTKETVFYGMREAYHESAKRKGYSRNGYGSLGWVFEGNKSIEEVREFQKGRPFTGNAPVPRAVPLGLLPGNLITIYAIINAEATHPHPHGRIASLLIAWAGSYLLKSIKPAKDIIKYCLEMINIEDELLVEQLKHIDNLPHPGQLVEADYNLLCGAQPIKKPWFPEDIKGLPSDAFLTAASALYILKYASDAFTGLKISILLGGDVDSLASVTTSILSAKYGINSLPQFMITNVEKDFITDVTFRFKTFLKI